VEPGADFLSAFLAFLYIKLEFFVVVAMSSPLGLSCRENVE
jgi:hypothetical protein